MAATSAARKWAERVKRQERSGLSLRRFAEREGLKAGTLSFWKWKMGQERCRRESSASMEAVKFIELTAAPAPTPTGKAPAFEVQLRSGRSVRVTAGFDAAELARLLAVIEEGRT